MTVRDHNEWSIIHLTIISPLINNVLNVSLNNNNNNNNLLKTITIKTVTLTLKTIMINGLPAGQVQVNPDDSDLQAAPFSQGLEEQKLMVMLQFSPVKPVEIIVNNYNMLVD